MKILQSKYSGIIFVLTLTLIIFTWGWLADKSLLKNHQLSIAKIISCSYNSTRGHSGISLNYTFELKGKIHAGSVEFGNNNLNINDAQSFFVGKTFPVLYNPNHPENHQILITQKTFKHFKIPFPDSLKWILQYMHK